MRPQLPIGFDFAFHWLKNGREILKPITKRNCVFENCLKVDFHSRVNFTKVTQASHAKIKYTRSYERLESNLKVEPLWTFTQNASDSYNLFYLFTHVKPYIFTCVTYDKFTRQWKSSYKYGGSKEFSKVRVGVCNGLNYGNIDHIRKELNVSISVLYSCRAIYCGCLQGPTLAMATLKCC